MKLIYGFDLKIDISDAIMYLKIFRFLEMSNALKEMDQAYSDIV